MITIIVNGAMRQLPQSISISDLIDDMGMTGKRVALERNGEIVPRSAFTAQKLAEGDKLEIVVAVGGG